MRRLAAMTGALALAAASAIAMSGAQAGADAPSQQGWWIASNPGSVLGSPTPPAPPDVPPDGLLIEGGTNSGSPTAYAAIVYQLPSQATVGSLTLNVAPNSGTTPATSLQVCPLKSPGINAEQGGPMSDAPPYKTTGCVTKAESSSGSSYTFDVSSFVVDETLAIAILPTTSTDRVVLSKPGADSLAVQSAGSSSSGSTGTTYGGSGSSDSGSGSFGSSTGSSSGSSGSSDTGSFSGGFTALPSTGGVSSISTPSAATPTPAAAAQPAAAPAVAPRPAAATPAKSDFPLQSGGPGTTAAKPWAVGLLLAGAALGLLLWTIAGRAARAAAHTPRQA